MHFKKYLYIKGHTIRISEDAKGAYVLQYDLDQKVIPKRFYTDKEALCAALEKYLPREEILNGL